MHLLSLASGRGALLVNGRGNDSIEVRKIVFTWLQGLDDRRTFYAVVFVQVTYISSLIDLL